MFVNENVNPRGRKTGDCVIRAIAKAENKEWLEIFDALVAIARESYSVPSDTVTYTKYLKKYQTKDVMYYDDSYASNRRYTVNDIKVWVGTYIVQVAGHLTVVQDGKLFDTWDCGNKSAYKIWKVQ